MPEETVYQDFMTHCRAIWRRLVLSGEEVPSSRGADTRTYHVTTQVSGGCMSIEDKIRRRFTTPARFNCSFSTVARPVGVKPITNV